MDANEQVMEFVNWLKLQARYVERYITQRDPEALRALHVRISTMRDYELPAFHRRVYDALLDLEQVEMESPIETAGLAPTDVAQAGERG